MNNVEITEQEYQDSTIQFYWMVNNTLVRGPWLTIDEAREELGKLEGRLVKVWFGSQSGWVNKKDISIVNN